MREGGKRFLFPGLGIQKLLLHLGIRSFRNSEGVASGRHTRGSGFLIGAALSEATNMYLLAPSCSVKLCCATCDSFDSHARIHGEPHRRHDTYGHPTRRGLLARPPLNDGIGSTGVSGMRCGAVVAVQRSRGVCHRPVWGTVRVRLLPRDAERKHS
jgi:hypothetical protein